MQLEKLKSLLITYKKNKISYKFENQRMNVFIKIIILFINF